MEQNNKLSLVEKLQAATPSHLVTLPEVADRFKNIYMVMNGGNAAVANTKYEAEKFHFMKLIQDKKDLQQCTKLSLYGVFLDMAVNGLSFDPGQKHAYVVSFNTNVGTKNDPKWEKRATLMISGYGELHMRTRQGQIKYADNPVLVYEGDEFRYGTKDGKVFLDHVATFPRKSDNIIACYLRIERNDGSVDYKVFGIDEVLKLKAFSKDPNSLAWTSGLPGMIQAKTIKHAFKSYPRMRLGEFSQLHSAIIDEDAEVMPRVDYGLNGSMPKAGIDVLPAATAEHTPLIEDQVPRPRIEDDAFVAPAAKPATATRSFDDDEF